MPEPAPQRSSHIASEAAAWVLRCDRGLTAAEQDDFSSWLAANPQHGAEFARLRQHWRRLDSLAGWRPGHGNPNPDLLKPRWRSRMWNWVPLAAAAAVVAAIATVGVSLSFRDRPTENAAATPAKPSALETGPRRLEDGSIAELNRGAELQVAYTASERRVRLARGEAHFSVRKDPSRPFVVEVGGISVRAVGTAFNVRLGAGEVEVLVTQGSVEVATRESRPNAEAATPSEKSAEHAGAPLIRSLAARQRAVISLAADQAAPQIATLTAGEIERVLSWQERVLDFSATPLSEIVAAFNRRNVVQLVVADPELGALRVSGTFRSDNIDGLVHLLAAGFGAQAEPRGDEIVLRKAR